MIVGLSDPSSRAARSDEARVLLQTLTISTPGIFGIPGCASPSVRSCSDDPDAEVFRFHRVLPFQSTYAGWVGKGGGAGSRGTGATVYCLQRGRRARAQRDRVFHDRDTSGFRTFHARETDELADDLDRLMSEWASRDSRWTGPWREVYLDPVTEKKSTITAMHDLALLLRRMVPRGDQRRLTEAMAELLGPTWSSTTPPCT